MTELIPSFGMIADLAREVVEKKKYLRNFYDKAANVIIGRFTNAIVKSRPVKEAGAQQVRRDSIHLSGWSIHELLPLQLLLDLQALKAALLKLPGPQGDAGLASS